jgi:dienelactone hydrolase
VFVTSRRTVAIPARGAVLRGLLSVPTGPSGGVVFAHGSGSSRLSPRNLEVADVLQRAGLLTLLFDLLTEEESANRRNVFDVRLLARRLGTATRWLREQPEARDLPLGYFGASTGAAAALWSAADPGLAVRAVVSRGGRPDLARPRLARVRAPTLLIVGGADSVVVELNRAALDELSSCEHDLAVIPGATHLFEEPGALNRVAEVAAEWFVRHLRDARTMPVRRFAGMA